ncbi:MAG: fibronectin type 3 domain-containing protein [Rhodothermales bacterium]
MVKVRKQAFYQIMLFLIQDTESFNGDTDANYYYSLTNNSGTIYVRVTDTDQSTGNRDLDTVFVDYMMIRVDNDGGVEPPPGNPSGLEVTSTSYNQVNLIWADGSSNETGFRVERSDSGIGDWGTAGETGANATSFQDTGVEANTTYDYRVFAFNFAGDSAAPSNMVEATTGTAPPPAAIELFVSADKNKGKHEPQLTWDSGEIVAVYFNGGSSSIATGVATGWVHAAGNKGGGISYTYSVCETGATSVCSDPEVANY